MQALFQDRVNPDHDRSGHISKHAPSMLKFIFVNAAHMVIKYSKKMKIKYLRPERTLGKNRAIVALARILAETIWTMLSRCTAFYDEMDILTDREMESMRSRSLHPGMKINVKDAIKLIKNQEISAMSDQLF